MAEGKESHPGYAIEERIYYIMDIGGTGNDQGRC